jgi:hypothetical protein
MIALLPVAALSSVFSTLTRWLPRAPQSGEQVQPPQQPTRPVQPQGGLPRQPRLARGPVRVLDGSAPGGSGRLVISGRMADVCAELERLALREQAACH